LSAATHAVAEVLRNDLRGAFTALRSLSTPPATSAGTNTYPILGAIMREQTQVVAEHVADLQRFLARPRSVELSGEFLMELSRQLEHAADGTRQPSLLWDRHLASDALAAPGPITLAPVVAPFLWAYVRRRADASVVSARISPTTMTITYPRRSSVGTTAGAWPSLLVRLTLQPWAWHIRTRTGSGAETLSLAPASQASFQPSPLP
jgi:hypothetical protein